MPVGKLGLSSEAQSKQNENVQTAARERLYGGCKEPNRVIKCAEKHENG